MFVVIVSENVDYTKGNAKYLEAVILSAKVPASTHRFSSVLESVR